MSTERLRPCSRWRRSQLQSGMYFWKLDDGTRVVMGTPDTRVMYIDWMKADGTKERLLGGDAR